MNVERSGPSLQTPAAHPKKPSPSSSVTPMENPMLTQGHLTSSCVDLPLKGRDPKVRNHSRQLTLVQKKYRTLSLNTKTLKNPRALIT